jgi:outer membrane protein assembly factor BamB
MRFRNTGLATLAVAIAAFVFTLSRASAADWPAFRGPAGNGIVAEKLALNPWPADGLKVVWRVPTATGFSSFSVAEGKVFTLERRPLDGAEIEACVARAAANGQELWTAKLSVTKYDGGGDSGGPGDGPRSTPVVNGGKVYVFDSRLLLTCLDAKSGAVVWRRDLVAEHSGRIPKWQSAASPVIDGDLVFVAGGGSSQALLGLNKLTGAVAWKTQDDRATHSTPLVAEIGGVRQVIFFTQEGLVAVVPRTGLVLWRYAFPFRVATAITPVVAGDLVYCSAAYEVGAAAVRVTRKGTGFEATEVWRKPKELLNHWSTPVVKDGYLYGLYGHAPHKTGPLKCIEVATGKEMWSQAGFGPGGLILAGDRLIVLGDQGQLVLVEANTAAYNELSRMQAVTGKCWSTPALSNGRLYVRSVKEGACLAVAGQ